MPPPSVDPHLLSVLACPKCKGDLTLSGDEKGLICESCRIVYPIRGGIPVMLAEEARPVGMGGEASPSMTAPQGAKTVFSVVEGKNKGEVIELEEGTCRAIGRSLDDTQSTRIFSVDSAITLDDTSKKLVIQYVSRQFKKGGGSRKKGGGEAIGSFVRGPDFQVSDLAVSRLHAMIFFDESGEVGILDLVSKNGTFVNGVEVESRVLKKGDLVTIGGTKIRFESGISP